MSSLDEYDADHADDTDHHASDVPQKHGDVVLDRTWWWAAHLSLCAVAIVANVLFLVTVIYNRYETVNDLAFNEVIVVVYGMVSSKCNGRELITIS